MAPTPGPGPRAVLCTCGHDRDQHTHLRAGRDCGACGCARFRAPGLRAVLDRVTSFGDRSRGPR